VKDGLAIILTEAIKHQDPYLDFPVDLSQGAHAKLYAEGGQLDSLSLVTIIADVEQKIADLFGVKVQLANERDLTLEGSPFNTFGEMLDYIEDRVRSVQLSNRGSA
jgi:hypothetical protein